MSEQENEPLHENRPNRMQHWYSGVRRRRIDDNQEVGVRLHLLHGTVAVALEVESEAQGVVPSIFD